MTTAWHQWIGLPHEVGADPIDGVAADCLVMCHRVRTAAGLWTPRLDPMWFTMAAAGEWAELEREWGRLMVRCDAEPYAMLLSQQPSCLGVSIRLDDGILAVHHRRGVQWLPIEVAGKLMRLEYWRPRNAAI
jgi:hypothetical protein